MLDRIEHLINYVLDSTGKLACLCLIALVGVIGYNVIGRYMFNNSSIALEELAWHLYSSVFLLGIAYAVRTGSHVRVDLIYEGRSERSKAWIDIVGTLVFMVPFSALVLYHGSSYAYQSFSYGTHAETLSGLINQFFTDGIGEKSQDPGGLNNRFVIKSVIPLSFLLVLLSAVSLLLNRINILKRCSSNTGDKL